MCEEFVLNLEAADSRPISAPPRLDLPLARMPTPGWNLHTRPVVQNIVRVGGTGQPILSATQTLLLHDVPPAAHDLCSEISLKARFLFYLGVLVNSINFSGQF